MNHQEFMEELLSSYKRDLFEGVFKRVSSCRGISYLKTDAKLTSEQREYLHVHAFLMSYTDRRNTSIKTNTMEGRLKLSKDFTVIGGIAGRQFTAEVDVAKGKARIELIVSDYTEGIHSSN